MFGRNFIYARWNMVIKVNEIPLIIPGSGSIFILAVFPGLAADIMNEINMKTV